MPQANRFFYMNPKNLYIVTGSTKGIGNALVKMLLKDEHNLVIGLGRSDGTMEIPNFRFVQVDLSQAPLSDQLLTQIFPTGDFEKVVLVNNAGWIGQVGYIGDLAIEEYHKLLQINVIAPAFLMNEYVRRYKDARHQERLVVNISSGAARKVIDGWAGYASSKAALNQITQIAQEEANLTGSGIRFFALAPGVVDTEMQTAIRESSKASFSALEKFIDLKEKGQLSSPSETAEKIMYLLRHPAEFEEVIQDVRKF